MERKFKTSKRFRNGAFEGKNKPQKTGLRGNSRGNFFYSKKEERWRGGRKEEKGEREGWQKVKGG